MKKDYSKYKWEIYFLFSILMFFIAYGIVFNQILLNDDSIERFYSGRSYGIHNGRFLGVFLTNLVGRGVNNPIVTSMLTYITMLITSIYALKIFEVKRLRTMLAICATVFTYPIYGIYWRFGSDMWLYTLVGAMSFAAMYYIMNKHQKTVVGYILIVLSLAIYQGEIALLTMLFSTFYIEQIITGKFVYRDLIRSLTCISLAFITYFIIIKIGINFSDSELVTYKAASDIGFISIFSNLVPNIKNSYFVYLMYITGNLTYYDYFHLPLFWIFFNLLPLCYVLINLIYCKLSTSGRFWLLLLTITIPISMNIQQLITNDYMTRTWFGNLILMIYIVIIILEKFKLPSKFGIVIVVIALSMNLNSLNSIELAAVSLHEENVKIGNQILLDLRSFDSYQTDKEVAVCGSLTDNENYNYPRLYPYVFGVETFTDMHGVTYNFFLNIEYMPEYTTSIATLFYQYLGEEINFVENECDSNAPEFPEPGYIYEKNGIININYGS